MKKILGGLLIAAGLVFLVPSVSHAQNPNLSSLRAQIQNLLVVVQDLQRQVLAIRQNQSSDDQMREVREIENKSPRISHVRNDELHVGEQFVIQGYNLISNDWKVYFGDGNVALNDRYLDPVVGLHGERNKSRIAVTVPSSVQPAWSCPSGMACATVMPQPENVEAGSYDVWVENIMGESNRVEIEILGRLDKSQKAQQKDSDTEIDEETGDIDDDDEDQDSEDSMDEDDSDEITIEEVQPLSVEIGDTVKISGEGFHDGVFIKMNDGYVKPNEVNNTSLGFVVPTSLKEMCHFSTPPCLASETAVTSGAYEVSVIDDEDESNAVKLEVL